MDSKYLPWVIGGGVILLLFFALRGGGSSPAAGDSRPRFSSVNPGPTDHSYDALRLQDNFQRTQLAASLFGGLLQRDFALKQLDKEDAFARYQIQAQLDAIKLQQAAQNQSSFLNAQTGGMVR